MEIRKKQKWECDNHKIDWSETKSVHISYPPGSLEQDWKEEALRHREEIENLNKKILTLEEIIRKANNNVLKDISMIKTHEMIKEEIVQRLIETSKILESVSDK